MSPYVRHQTKVTVLDFEATDTNPWWGQATEAAWQTLDSDFYPVGTVTSINAKPDDYCLPTAAALVTQDKTWDAVRTGVSQAGLAAGLADVAAKQRPSFMLAHFGHGFDWKLAHHTLYRAPWGSLYPFQTGGNVIGDTLDLFHIVHVCTPGAMIVPPGANASLTFSLGAFAMANGYLPINPHVAADDVQTLVHLLRTAKWASPEAVSLFLERGKPDFVRSLFRDAEDILIWIRGNGSDGLDIRVIVPIGPNPAYRNQHVSLDMQFDVAALRGLSQDELIAAIADNKQLVQKPAVNHMPPILSPDTAAGRVALAGMDIGSDMIALAKEIRRDPDFCRRLIDAVTAQPGYPEGVHVEERIYGSFPPPRDADVLAAFQATPDIRHKRRLIDQLQDPRFRELAMRRMFNDHPEGLSTAEIKERREWFKNRLLTTESVPWPTVPKIRKEIEKASANGPTPRGREILGDYEKQLLDYEKQLRAL